MASDNKAKAAAGAGAAAAAGAGADAKAAAGGAAAAADADGNSASLHPFGGVNGAHLYNLQLELNRPAATEGKAAHAKLKQQGVHVVFVLDNSGSMGQDFTRTVIPLVNQSFERLKPNAVVPDIIIFDDTAHHITLQELQSKRASGGTEFGRALEKLQTVIRANDNRTHQVIFLTDGQASFPTAQLKGFQSHIFGLRVGVHALGISAYDVNFLSKFVEIGTIPGTFQGSEKGTAFDLNGAAQKIIELVGGETGRSRAFIDLGATMALADPFKVAVANAAEAKAAAAAPGGPAGAAVAAADKMANHDAKKAEAAAAAAAKGKDGKAAAADVFVRPGIPTEIVWKQDGPSFVSLWVVSSEEKRLTKADAVAVTVHLEEAAPVKLRAAVVEDAGAGNDLFAGWLGERLGAISQTILSSESPDVKQLKAIVDEVDKEAQKQTAQIWQIKDKEKRNAVFERFKGVQELLKGCHEALAQIAVGKLDRDSKARLLNQAYQRRLEENSCANKKIAKLVTKRMADNAGQAESTAVKIAELKAANSAAYGQLASSIVDSHPSLTTFFDYMRASNWVELLSEGEAIGVSLAMKARTVGIVAPAVIKIDRVNTSCLSLDAYLDACRFQLVDKQNDPTKISSILPGMSRESINGAMGLYIHPLHWQSARLLLPQVLSQMTVGTPLAYAAEMMKTLPFTALMRMVTDLYLAAELKEGAAQAASGEGSGAALALSDASLVLFWQLFRTCAHIAEAYKLHDAKSNAFAPLITSDAPDLAKCAPLWGTDALPATPILYGVRLAVQGAAVPDADDDKAQPMAAAGAGAGAGAGAAAAPAGKAVAGTVIVNPWADAKAGDAKDVAAAGAPAFYAQALAEEVRRYCDWKFPNKAPDTVAAADKVLDALIDIAGEPKAAAPAAGAAAAAKSPLEQRALKAWMELTKGAADAKGGDAKDAKAGGAAAAAGAAGAAAAAEEKPFVFDPKSPSDAARKAAGEFEAGAWKQFEQLNAYQAFSALYAQLLAKHGGRAALLKSIDDNYGVAPEPLLRATKQAFTERKAARAKAVAAGPGAAAVSANREFLSAAGVSSAVFDSSLLRALIISGIHNRSNPDRRDAIDRKAYVNPLSAAADVTVAERKRQLTAKAAALGKAAHANAVAEAAHMFMRTTVECAAGILLTQFADRGHADFKELHDVLESREWVTRAGADAVAKLFMVVDGTYKGFALQNGGKPWAVGKRTVHRIWTAYDPKLLPAEVLLKRFGHRIHCMDCWKKTPGHGAEHVHRGKNRAPKPPAKPDPNSKRSAKKAAKKK